MNPLDSQLDRLLRAAARSPAPASLAELPFPAKARVATPEEKAEMWKTMTAEWPAYDDYQKKTDREIPIVVLERS